jgi:hypothetical protein
LQKQILLTRLASANKASSVHPDFSVAFFRPLTVIRNQEHPVWVSFMNPNTVHQWNAILALRLHNQLGLEFSSIRFYTPFDLSDWKETYLPKDAQQEQGRGYHYWAWKPFILWQTMQVVPQGSLILYTDSGLYVNHKERYRERVLDVATKQGYCFFRNTHSTLPYCKWELVEYGLKHGIVSKNALRDSHMVDASFLCIQNTPSMTQFVLEWMKLCGEPFLVSDISSEQPVSVEQQEHKKKFIDHRHDQSLLTILLLKYAMKYDDLKRDFTLHHRSRSIQELKEKSRIHLPTNSKHEDILLSHLSGKE